MALDRYITLGRSGLRVSPLRLGAMTFGEEHGWGSSVAESEHILDKFIDLGGNFITMQPLFPAIHNGGAAINGTYAKPMLMQPGEKPY